MILQFDTNTKEIKEILQDTDSTESKYEREAQVATMLASAVVANATKYFKNDKVRRAYVNKVFHTAEAMLDNCIIREEYEGE